MNDARDRNNVRVIRVAIGMTQQDLADSAGLSQGFVHMVETGQKHPSPRTRRAIAAALEVNELLAFPAPVFEPGALYLSRPTPPETPIEEAAAKAMGKRVRVA